jgi:cytidine deaminase
MEDLLEAARAARAHAYAPYSGFAVGAALRAADGRIFAAANVENAAYPLGTCAEAGALALMIAGGARRAREALVLGDGFCPPCGGCRQRLLEFMDPDAAIHVCSPAGAVRTLRLAELLPHPFRLDPVP